MMMDIIEMYECAAEASYYEMEQPDGRLKCGCGRIFDPNKEGGPLARNPYAMPVCGECFKVPCPGCGEEFDPMDLMTACPGCGHRNTARRSDQCQRRLKR